MTEYEKLSDIELQRLASMEDRGAEEELAGRYMQFVRQCARPLFLAGGDSEDLIQEGTFGLLSAIRRFDPACGVSFKTFAEHCVRMRLLSAIKSASRLKHFPLNDGMSLEELSEDSSTNLSAFAGGSGSGQREQGRTLYSLCRAAIEIGEKGSLSVSGRPVL